MKKVLCYSLLVLFVNALSAQLQYGVKAGLNYNIISVNIKQGSSTETDNPTGIGFHLGGYGRYSISEKLAFRPELLFSSCRTKENSETTETKTLVDFTDGSDYTATTTSVAEDKSAFNYIQIPLLADYSVTDNISLQAGPSIGLLMGYKNEYTYSYSTKYSNGDPTFSTNSSVTSSSKSGINTLNFGLAIGANYQLENGLSFGFRYDRGLSSINSIFTDFVTQHWNVIQLSLGYQISK